ncbi:hypothetical protein C9I36_18100 [Pectobacterium punjabense]|nr:hypothetical protein C9I36_18100 [Pectobacterium punjabense]
MHVHCLRSFTRITYLSKLIKTLSFVTFLKLESFKINCIFSQYLFLFCFSPHSSHPICCFSLIEHRNK